jgi:hypothetical protein
MYVVTGLTACKDIFSAKQSVLHLSQEKCADQFVNSCTMTGTSLICNLIGVWWL